MSKCFNVDKEIKDKKMRCIKLLKFRSGRYQRGPRGNHVLCDVLFYSVPVAMW